jgi:hypothetical protein
VALTVVLAVGCSSSKGSSSTATTLTTVTPATPGVTGAAGPSTTTPSFSGSKNSKYCNLARQFSSTLNPNLSGDPKTLFQQFDSLASQYLALVPPEIKGDAQTVIGAIRQLETKIKAVNYDLTKLAPADLAPVQDPKFTASANRIDAYDSQVCGLTTTTT